MKKRPSITLLTVLLAMVFAASIGVYSSYIGMKIYQESSDHLLESFSQISETFTLFVQRNWTVLSQWDGLLKNADIDHADSIGADMQANKESWHYSDFYLFNESTQYLTAAGRRGSADSLSGVFQEMYNEGGPIVSTYTASYGVPKIVFAMPLSRNMTLDGVTYTGLAVSYDTDVVDDLVDGSMYGGQSDCYIVRTNGDIVLALEPQTELCEGMTNLYDIDAHADWIYGTMDDIRDCVQLGRSGSAQFICQGGRNYLVAIPTAFPDWTLVGIIRADEVDGAMRSVQQSTIIALGALCIFAVIIVVLALGMESQLRLRREEEERLSLEREKMQSDRLLQSMSRIVDRYSIVNLDTDRYRYRELRNSEPLYPSSGRYSDMVETISRRYVALTETENAKLSRLITPEYLRSVLRRPDDNLKIEYCSRTENAYMVLTVIPVEWHADGTVYEVMQVVQDIGQKIELENMANTDSMTGLFNERYFSRVLNICEEKKLPFVLYYLDLDRFKPINDTYGHLMGDREVNQALSDAVAAAQSASRAKSDFLTNMSHDIRTPMNAIIGFTTLAVSNISDTERVRDYLTKTLASSRHLLSLINDILDMSRIESGKLHLEESEVSLSDVLHDIKTIISGQVHAKQLELYMDAIDVADEDVYCDRTRLGQILLNLLSNAIKFTPAGGTVSVRVRQNPGTQRGCAQYEFRIRDTGIGMSAAFAARIFEPFERERTSTVSRIQGTGLGMAITRNIVDMMGGTIEVQTEQGRGTEFTVCLPMRVQTGRRCEEKIEELAGLKALVVDDDFNTCDSVTKLLTRVGMRAEWTLSGREAVLRARQSIELGDPCRAYIIDWRLPDMNGIEVTRQIRSLNDDTPIIILTAYDWSDIEVEARAAGVTAFCSKPMFLSDLRDTLLTAIGHAAPAAAEPDVLPEAQADFRGRRVLLVEDNELNREIAVEILHEYGFLVDTAENGAIAVDKVQTSPADRYDLVLMDIQMPVMDGYTATRRIRALNDPARAAVPIVAMTANVFEEERKRAFDCGMNGFLSKPLVIEALLSALRDILH